MVASSGWMTGAGRLQPDNKTMITGRALDVVRSVEEIEVEVAALWGESETRMDEALELLKRIGISVDPDIG